MLLSRLDEGRAVPVEPRAGLAGTAVAHQLDMLLGEHLLPLRTRRTPDEPHLLAVDAAGQPVVVEVVGLLDAQVCLRALRHAGAAARMTDADIAAAYRGGAHLFGAHFDAFRSTVTASSQLSTQVRSGARLMLVCTDVSPDVDDVLEFLLQPGWQVEVLCVRVTHDSRGAKVADVVPVERSAPRRDGLFARRPVPVRTGGIAAVPEPAPYTPSSPPADHRGARPAPTMPTVVPPSFAVVREHHAPPRRGEDAHPRQRDDAQPWRRDDADTWRREDTDTWQREDTDTWRRDDADARYDDVPSPHDGAELHHGGAQVAVAVRRGVDPDVADLASLMGGPVDLVWNPGTGRTHEVLLHVDGRIELPDGTFVDDVATAAERLHGPVRDARVVWRVGDSHGPTLAELLG